MNRLKSVVERGAGVAMAAGFLVGVGSCSVDVLTCPMTVEGDGVPGDAGSPIPACDENPESDDWFNNPGTTEQKIMYSGFAIASIGCGVVVLMNRNSDTEKQFSDDDTSRQPIS